jgi:phage/plasmid-associated DNA primase
MNGFVIDINKVRDITTLVGKELNQYVDKELLETLRRCYKGEGEWTSETIQILSNMSKGCTENRFKVAYHFTKNNPYNLGRYYAANNLSLGSLARDARHALCKDTYVDIDAVCSQQSLLVSLCTTKQYEKPYDAIKDYVENRSQRLKEIMDFYEVDRETAKQLMTTLTNCGTLKSWANKHKVENQLMLPFLDKYKKQKASYVSLWYQTYERMILDTIIYFLVEAKDILDGFVPCHDGIMIHKKDYYEGLEKEIEDYINSNLYLNLRFIKKPMDEPYEMKEVSILQELNTMSAREFFKKYLEDEQKQYETLLELPQIKDKFICCGEDLYYCNKYGLWKKDTVQNRIIYNIIKEALYQILKECLSKAENEQHLATKNSNNPDELHDASEKFKGTLKAIRGEIKNATKSTFIEKHIKNICRAISVNRTELPFDKNPRLFALNDKVLDIQDLSNIHFRDINPTDYISMTTGYNYCNQDIDAKNKLMDILKTIQPNQEVRNYWLWIYARALIGERVESIYQLNGSGRNGKGLSNYFFQNTFGDYYYALNNSVLMSEMKVGGCPELALLDKKRIVVCAEIDKKNRINSATIKTLTGGDSITTRNLYERDITSFRASFSLFLEVNGKVMFTNDEGNALKDRFRDIVFPSRFTDNPAKVNLLANVYPQMGNYKSKEFFTDTMAMNLLYILVDSLKENGMKYTVPQKIVDDTELYFKTVSSIPISWFNDEFERIPYDMTSKDYRKNMFEQNQYNKCSYIYDRFKKSEAFKAMERNEKAMFKLTSLINILKTEFPDDFIERYRVRIGDTQVEYTNIMLGWRVSNNSEVVQEDIKEIQEKPM